MEHAQLEAITRELWASRESCYHEKHGRDIHLCRLDRESIAKQLVSEQRFQLFKWEPNNLTLRFPERCLLDLSRLPISTTSLSADTLLEVWASAKVVARNLAIRTGCIVIRGNHQQSAIYVCGPNLDVLDAITRDFRRMFLADNFRIHPQLPSCASCIDLPNKSKTDIVDSSMFLPRLRHEYSQVYGDEIMGWVSFPSGSAPYASAPVWQWVHARHQTVLFVLHAGTPLFLNYLACPHVTGSVNVTEIHAQNDPYEFLRTRPTDDWIFPPIDPNIPCIIIDKAFSGTTLALAKDRAPAGSRTFALYPKTFSAIMRCDFALFGDRIVTHASLSGLGLTQDNWVSRLIQNIHRIGEEIRCHGA